MAKIKELQAELAGLIPFMQVEEPAKMHVTVNFEPVLNPDACNYKSVYIGSFIFLDPCGRYHCVLSPNGAAAKCERFWEKLDKAASNLGGWISSGEGDPTDIYFCMPADK